MDRIGTDQPTGIFHRAHRICRPALLVLLVFPQLLSCTLFEKNKLRDVKSAGELVVLTRTSPTTYYETPEGPAGFEYDLVKSFANYLGVKPRFVVAEKFNDIIPRLLKGDAALAAAGITVTEARSKLVRFGPPYQEIRQQVIYRLGTNRPASAEELIGRQIEVQAGTSYVERLNELKQQYPELKWTEVDKETEELLQVVWEGLLEISIADSNIVAINRQYFPEIQVAFSLQKPEPLAWAFPLGEDQSLYDAAVKFLEKSRASGGAGATDRSLLRSGRPLELHEFERLQGSRTQPSRAISAPVRKGGQAVQPRLAVARRPRLSGVLLGSDSDLTDRRARHDDVDGGNRRPARD